MNVYNTTSTSSNGQSQMSGNNAQPGVTDAQMNEFIGGLQGMIGPDDDSDAFAGVDDGDFNVSTFEMIDSNTLFPFSLESMGEGVADAGGESAALNADPVPAAGASAAHWDAATRPAAYSTLNSAFTNSNSYMDDLSGSNSLLVDPNSVMPMGNNAHNRLQLQQQRQQQQQQQQQQTVTQPQPTMATRTITLAPHQQSHRLNGTLTIRTTPQFAGAADVNVVSPAGQANVNGGQSVIRSVAATATSATVNQQQAQMSPVNVTGYQIQQQQQQQPKPVQYGFNGIAVSNGLSVNTPTHVSVANGRQIKTLKVIPPVSSPVQQVPHSPVTLGQTVGQQQQQQQQQHLGTNVVVTGAAAAAAVNNNTNRKKNQNSRTTSEKENGFPKPGFSYSCLIHLALKNSRTGSMSVAEIYKFMCEHFPYFKSAPHGWKNSVRHNLSLNKCFEKIEKPPTNGANQRKGCLWAINPAKITKMDEEVQKWSRKDPMAVKKGMLHPGNLALLERGEMVKDYSSKSTSSPVPISNHRLDSEDEEDPRTPNSVSSQGSNGSNDLVEIETNSAIPVQPESSMVDEIYIKASGGIYEELGDDRLQSFPVASATPTNRPHSVGGVGGVQESTGVTAGGAGAGAFYSTAIHGNYSIGPAAGGGGGAATGPDNTKYNTLVIQKHEGQKIFSI